MSVQKEGTEQPIIEYFQLYPDGWARKSTWLCKSRDFCENCGSVHWFINGSREVLKSGLLSLTYQPLWQQSFGQAGHICLQQDHGSGGGCQFHEWQWQWSQPVGHVLLTHPGHTQQGRGQLAGHSLGQDAWEAVGSHLEGHGNSCCSEKHGHWHVKIERFISPGCVKCILCALTGNPCLHHSFSIQSSPQSCPLLSLTRLWLSSFLSD